MTSFDTEVPRSRKVSLKSIVWVTLLACAATAAYMIWIVKFVPKTVSNSKAGIFAELSESLIDVYQTEKGLVPAAGFDSINGVLKEKFSESPIALKPASGWILKSWADSRVHGRPMLLVRYDSTTVPGEKLLVSFVPISKRNFPRTGGFSYKDAWFFTYGKDYTAPAAEAAFPNKQVASHLEEMKRFESLGLNLVATNYGNDFFILMLSSVESKALARDLFEMSTIYLTPPQ